jgi:hypothetical protein
MKTRRNRRSPWTVPLLNSTGLALLAAGAATWFLWPPPEQVARIQLYARLNPPSILYPAENRLGGEEFLRNQDLIIKDRFVLNAALNQPEVAKLEVLKEHSDRLQWLEDEIKVEFPRPEFIQISMSGDRPEELLVIVKAVRTAYLEKTGDKELAEREVMLANLKAILEDWVGRAKINKKKLRDLQERAGAANPENMALVQKIALEELDAARTELVKVRSEIRRLRVEIGLKPEWREAFWPQYVAVLGSAPAHLFPLNFALVGLLNDEFLVAQSQLRFFVPQAQLDNDPIAAELLKKIGRLKADVITVKANSSSDAAFQKDSASLRSALDLAQEELEKRRQELRSQREKDARANAQNEERANGTRPLRERYAAALALEKALLEEVKKLDEMTANRNRVAVDLTELKDEIAMSEEVVKDAKRKFVALELEQKAPPRVREFGGGSIYIPQAGLRMRVAVAATLAGLGALLLVLAWLRSRSSGRVSPGASSREAHVAGS